MIALPGQRAGWLVMWGLFGVVDGDEPAHRAPVVVEATTRRWPEGRYRA
jgi:hypothetical protein